MAKISKCDFVTAEEAWQDVVDNYFDGDEEMAQGFEEALAESEHFDIYMEDVSTQSELVSYLEGLDGIREVNQSEMAAKVLTTQTV